MTPRPMIPMRRKGEDLVSFLPMSIAYPILFASSIPHCHRVPPSVQALVSPFQVITALFLRIIGCLLSWMGAQMCANKFLFAAVKKENRTESLLEGLWYFGSRFLVYSDNHGRALPKDFAAYREKGYCRGAC